MSLEAGTLLDSRTDAVLRPASVGETARSLRAAHTDGGCGHIDVDGHRCYVVDGGFERSHILALRTEAAAAGDAEQVERCDRALRYGRGSAAWLAVEGVLLDALPDSEWES